MASETANQVLRGDGSQGVPESPGGSGESTTASVRPELLTESKTPSTIVATAKMYTMGVRAQVKVTDVNVHSDHGVYEKTTWFGDVTGIEIGEKVRKGRKTLFYVYIAGDRIDFLEEGERDRVAAAIEAALAEWRRKYAAVLE